jgi:hypothetical protein
MVEVLKNVSRIHAEVDLTQQTKEGIVMFRSFTLIFTLLFLSSCGKGGGGSSTGTSFTNLTEQEITASPSAPVEAQTFDIEAQMSGFDREQEEKISRAFDLIKRVIATDEFKRKVLNKKYNGKKQYVDNGGLSNAEIYRRILEGSEMLTPGGDNVMDLHLESYFERQNVIGYTKPGIKTIFMNTKYLDRESFEISEVAMNLTHEWLHKLGFKHAFEKTPSRAHSVPYAIGYIMRTLARKVGS